MSRRMENRYQADERYLLGVYPIQARLVPEASIALAAREQAAAKGGTITSDGRITPWMSEMGREG